MKKYVPIFVVIILVLSVIGIAGSGSVWASPRLNAGANAPLRTLLNVTTNGITNVGGVCNITAEFKTTGNRIVADAEVPIAESKVVPFNGDGNLLFPGCHFVFYKNDKVVSPMSTDDATLKVCFGAGSNLQMGIYYYLDNAGSTGRIWTLLPTTMEDSGRLVCAPALYTGVYMPTGKVVPPPAASQADQNLFFPEKIVGSVRTPPDEIKVTESGTYAAGGICLIRAKYFVTGLSDTVQVEYPTRHYTEDTKTIPFSEYTNGDQFFFPGCHVIHYKDLKVQTQVNKTDQKDGEWEICFAAIPGKTMTIYYYDDNLTDMVAPWNPLVTTTSNGMSCADLANFSAVYAPAGK